MNAPHNALYQNGIKVLLPEHEGHQTRALDKKSFNDISF